MSRDFATASLVSLLSLVLAGPTGCNASKSDEVVAVAELAPLGASAVGGTVTFTAKNGKIHVEARIDAPRPAPEQPSVRHGSPSRP